MLDILNREAERLPIGSEGLLMLEYLQGNRTPWVDSDVRGMLYGLSLGHTPAHIYRAILGAVAGGAYEDIHTASQSMVQYRSTISPDAENHRRYQFYLKKYEEAYVLMKDWMHEVSSYSLK